MSKKLMIAGCGHAHILTLAHLDNFAGRSLLPSHPTKIRQRATDSLTSRSIKVIKNTQIKKIETGQLTDAEGIKYNFDIIFVAVGVKPNTIIAESGLPT